MIRDRHPNFGKAIVESWGFPQHLSDVVAEHENIDRRADTADVLTVAGMMAGFVGHETDLELHMQGA